MARYGYGLDSLILTLESWGIADVLLPFLLIFTIVFAVLQKTKILGDRKNFNVIIALIVGLSVVIPHVVGGYPPEADVVELINIIIPQISLVAVALLMLLLLVGIFQPAWVTKSISGVLAGISIIAVIIIFGGALGWWESGWIYYFGEDTMSVIVAILVFGIIIWFITREPGNPSQKIGKSIKGALEWLGGG